MEEFNVMPNDQHLKTTEGVLLKDNDATLADLSIFPDTLILAKVITTCYINKLFIRYIIFFYFKSKKLTHKYS